jgi:hypothetical protein
MRSWRKRAPRAKRRRYRASQRNMDDYLLLEALALKRRIDAIPPGMPRLLGTGPPGTACGQCCSYGYDTQHPNSCYQHFLLTSHQGEPLPLSTPSCPLFSPRDEGP